MVNHFQLGDFEISRHHAGNTIVLFSGAEVYYDLLTQAFYEYRFGPIFEARRREYEWGFFINAISEDERVLVANLLGTFQSSVYIDNALEQTFALDYHFALDERSEVGELVYRAKYKADKNCALELADCFADFIRCHPSYNRADYIASVPSYPNKPYDLPKFLVETLCATLSIQSGQHLIKKVRETEPMKDLNTEAEKFNNICGAFEVTDSEQSKGKTIIIVDDLIRSGMTLHELGMTLRRSGSLVLGLAATKTIRD